MEEKILFHIHRHNQDKECQYEIGRQYSTFEDGNYFWNVIASETRYIMFDDNIKQWPAMYADKCSKNKQIHPAGLDFIALCLKESGMFIRELVFEEIRRERYQDKPSRRNCIWLTEEKSINFWKKWLIDGQSKYDLIKMNCIGNFHKGNQLFLDSDIVCYNDYASCANSYWKGENTENTLNNEIIFTGKFTVKNIEKISV